MSNSTGRGRRTLLAVGAALAAAAAYVKLRSTKAEREHPPQGHFLTVDGVRLHYRERGQGQPLVLLHGNAAMIRDFELSGLFDMATRKYRVIAFDRPGYGYSERPRGRGWTPEAQADLLHQALRLLGVEQAIVLGHSWGALVAMAMALQYPQTVRGLVLLSGYYYPSARLDVPLAAPPAIPVVGDLMRYTVTPLMGSAMWPVFAKAMFAPAEVPAHFADYPKWMALRPGAVRASASEAALMVPAAKRLSQRYLELASPTVIMAGADDRIVDARAHSARLHEDLSGSELRLVPGAGHMIHHLVPVQVLEAIDRAADRARHAEHPDGRDLQAQPEEARIHQQQVKAPITPPTPPGA